MTDTDKNPSDRLYTSKYDKIKHKVASKQTQQVSKGGPNRILVWFIGGILVTALLMGSGLLNAPDSPPQDDNPTQSWNAHEETSEYDIILFSSPDCSCCHVYVEYLTDLGYNIDFRYSSDLYQFKEDLNIPRDAYSCHTAKIQGYIVEGHIPIDAINKLLEDKPDDIDGITLPGMPAGSPGMAGEKQRPFVIQSFADGELTGEFMQI